MKSSFGECEDYSTSVERDRSIALLDPLQVDAFFMSSLPYLNTERHLNELVQSVQHIVPSPTQLVTLWRQPALAALRDLGFLAASLTKHGIQLADVPGMEESLLKLALITDEVPRDTIYSYGSRNPCDQRMRTFTGLHQERIFIRGLTKSIECLPACIQFLLEAHHCSATDHRCAELLQKAAEEFHDMIKSNIDVMYAITPEIFSLQIQPYFPSIMIGEQIYFAPNGTQMAITVIDALLYGSKKSRFANKPEYRTYIDHNIIYLPPEFRCLIAKIQEEFSLVDTICEEIVSLIEHNQTHDTNARLAIKTLKELLQAILMFRYPHRKLAEDNMRLRPVGSIGSGGYTIEVLEMLINITRDAYNYVRHTEHLLNSVSPK